MGLKIASSEAEIALPSPSLSLSVLLPYLPFASVSPAPRPPDTSPLFLSETIALAPSSGNWRRRESCLPPPPSPSLIFFCSPLSLVVRTTVEIHPLQTYTRAWKSVREFASRYLKLFLVLTGKSKCCEYKENLLSVKGIVTKQVGLCGIGYL